VEYNKTETYRRRKENNEILKGRISKKASEIINNYKLNKTETRTVERIRRNMVTDYVGDREYNALQSLIKKGLIERVRLGQWQFTAIKTSDLDLS
jgi:hypothetical protein